jgi:hypothetical protein
MKKQWELYDHKKEHGLGGDFSGSSPSQAAKKAAQSKVAAMHKKALPKDKSGEVVVCVRQVTKGRGFGKVSCYNVKQKMLRPPRVIVRGGIEFKVTKEHTVTPVKLHTKPKAATKAAPKAAPKQRSKSRK